MADAATFGARYRVASSEPALRGHFPGHAVVPAAVLLRFVQRTLDAAGLRLAMIERMKFMRPAGPDESIDVTIAVLSTADSDARGSMTLRIGDDMVAAGTWRAAVR